MNVNCRKKKLRSLRLVKVIQINHVEAEYCTNYLNSYMQSQTEQYLDRKHLYKSPCTSPVVVIIK